MIDVKIVRENPQLLKDALERRQMETAVVDQLANMDEEWRAKLTRVEDVADTVVSEEAIAEVFDQQPRVRIVRLGTGAAPVVNVRDEIWINLEVEAGQSIIEELCRRNEGHFGLWIACLVHAPDHAAGVARILRQSRGSPERLGLVKRQYLRRLVR